MFISSTLEQKLAASEFDKVLVGETGGLNSETHAILRQAGMWSASRIMNSKSQSIRKFIAG